MDASKIWSLVGMDRRYGAWLVGWIIDMDLGWLVLVANMEMSMCVFFFSRK